MLPPQWHTTLGAVDGSTTENIASQLAVLPEGTSHLVLSVGGNDALLRADVLDAPVSSCGEALLLLGNAAAEFEVSYRRMVAQCLKVGLPLVVCTIYHGNFPDPSYRACVAVALTTYNDAIIRIASEHALRVIDLRGICVEAADYANPIEPSSQGGAKIAAAVAKAITEEPLARRGASVVAG